MKRKFTKHPVMSSSKYTAPVDLMNEDLDFIARAISQSLKNRDTVTTEDVIESVRMMCDEYDDGWARGLSKEDEHTFVYDLIDCLEQYGITDVVDNTFEDTVVSASDINRDDLAEQLISELGKSGIDCNDSNRVAKELKNNWGYNDEDVSELLSRISDACKTSIKSNTKYTAGLVNASQSYLDVIHKEVRKCIRTYLRKIGADKEFSSILENNEVIKVNVPGISKVSDLADYIYDTIGDALITIQETSNTTMEIRNSAPRIPSSTSISVSDEIAARIKDTVKTVMMSLPFGFEEDEVDEYSVVHITVEDSGVLKIEVGAEVSFDALMELAEALNPIVQEYDSEAYFDAEDAGRLVAYVHNSKIEGASPIMSMREYWLDPPEYDEPKYEDDTYEELEIEIDAHIIIKDEKGNWDYVDEDCQWARQGDIDNGDGFSSAEYGDDLMIADWATVVESIDDLLQTLLPMDMGKYRISGTATLCFKISDVYYESNYHGPDREDENGYEEREYDFDSATSEFVFDKSKISNFKYEKISDSVESATSIQGSVSSVKFGVPKMITNSRYDQYISAEYEGVKFSAYSNTVDTQDVMQAFKEFKGQVSEIHPYDDGDYYSAIIVGGTIMYKNSKGVVDRSYYMTADDWDMDLHEWFEAVLAEAIENLRQINKHVEQKIIYN